MDDDYPYDLSNVKPFPKAKNRKSYENLTFTRRDLVELGEIVGDGYSSEVHLSLGPIELRGRKLWLSEFWTEGKVIADKYIQATRKRQNLGITQMADRQGLNADPRALGGRPRRFLVVTVDALFPCGYEMTRTRGGKQQRWMRMWVRVVGETTIPTEDDAYPSHHLHWYNKSVPQQFSPNHRPRRFMHRPLWAKTINNLSEGQLTTKEIEDELLAMDDGVRSKLKAELEASIDQG